MDKEVRFVDANIFLEVLLMDKKWESAKLFLEKLENEELYGITSDYIVFSILIQIQNKTKSTKKMEDFVNFLGNVKGLKIIHFTPGILIKSTNNMEKHKLDFDDSLQLAFMETLGIKEIVSFDSHFDNIRNIKRVEPSDLYH